MVAAPALRTILTDRLCFRIKPAAFAQGPEQRTISYPALLQRSRSRFTQSGTGTVRTRVFPSLVTPTEPSVRRGAAGAGPPSEFVPAQPTGDEQGQDRALTKAEVRVGTGHGQQFSRFAFGEPFPEPLSGLL
jgi:hypothetical protein